MTAPFVENLDSGYLCSFYCEAKLGKSKEIHCITGYTLSMHCCLKLLEKKLLLLYYYTFAAVAIPVNILDGFRLG